MRLEPFKEIEMQATVTKFGIVLPICSYPSCDRESWYNQFFKLDHEGIKKGILFLRSKAKTSTGYKYLSDHLYNRVIEIVERNKVT